MMLHLINMYMIKMEKKTKKKKLDIDIMENLMYFVRVVRNFTRPTPYYSNLWNYTRTIQNQLRILSDFGRQRIKPRRNYMHFPHKENQRTEVLFRYPKTNWFQQPSRFSSSFVYPCWVGVADKILTLHYKSLLRFPNQGAAPASSLPLVPVTEQAYFINLIDLSRIW